MPMVWVFLFALNIYGNAQAGALLILHIAILHIARLVIIHAVAFFISRSAGVWPFFIQVVVSNLVAFYLKVPRGNSLAVAGLPTGNSLAVAGLPTNALAGAGR